MSLKFPNFIDIIKKLTGITLKEIRDYGLKQNLYKNVFTEGTTVNR